jgi:hypothetical protein
MTTLAKNVARAFELGDMNNLPVIAADIIYEGAAVGDNGSGYSRPLTAGDPFRGFAAEKADNSAGAAGAVNVLVKQRGRVSLAISGLAITDVGKAVYASDDDTFTLTATSNSYVGRVIRWVSTGVGIVEFDASKSALGTLSTLTDSTGGTANTTLQAVGATNGSDVSAAINNNFADLAAQVNALAAMIK